MNSPINLKATLVSRGALRLRSARPAVHRGTPDLGLTGWGPGRSQLDFSVFLFAAVFECFPGRLFQVFLFPSCGLRRAAGRVDRVYAKAFTFHIRLPSCTLFSKNRLLATSDQEATLKR